MNIKFDKNERRCEGYFDFPDVVVLCPKGINHRYLSGKKPLEEEIITETIKVINHELLHIIIAETENIRISEEWDCVCLHDPEYI
jgi:hypothetical protein